MFFGLRQTSARSPRLHIRNGVFIAIDPINFAEKLLGNATRTSYFSWLREMLDRFAQAN